MLTNVPMFLTGWWRSVASFDYYGKVLRFYELYPLSYVQE